METRRPVPTFAWPLVAGVLAACSTSPTTRDAATDAEDVAMPPMRCAEGTGWASDQPAFVNRTMEWGISEARGGSLAVGDIDNDGWADLVVVGGAQTRSNLDATPPVINTRVYLNRPVPGGTGRRFEDATRSSNLLEVRGGGYGRVVGNTAFADFDNDGDQDVYTSVWVNTDPMFMDPGDRDEVLLNDGHGVFHLAAEPVPVTDQAQSASYTFTDGDRDGNLDVFMAYWYEPPSFSSPFGQQHQLLRGDGTGRFHDVTDAVGLTMEHTEDSLAEGTNVRPLFGALACDLDGDGRQELVGATYGRGWNLLYQNQGARYVEVGRPAGVAADENLDYSTDHNYRCWCAANPGRCPSTVRPPYSGYACPGRGWQPGVSDQPWELAGNTFTIACGDVDSDGDMDLLTGEIAHPDVGTASDRSELLLNQSMGGTLRFTRPGRMVTNLVPPVTATQDEGILRTAFLDFDNDGRLDVYFGGTDYVNLFSYLYRQGDALRFTEIGATAGLRHPCASGTAIADFDHDGDLDVVFASSLMREWCTARWRSGPEVRFYENVSARNNWLQVRAVGRGAGGANRDGIGARVRVTAGSVTQTREILNTWGHGNMGIETLAHFGLGASCMVDRVEVRWPDAMGTTETFTNVRANYRLEIRQGEGRVRYLQ